MGLYIHSLGELPADAARGYFVYVLDYGWGQPLGDALHRNFDRMAESASRANAVVIRGPSVHFEDEVLSWHHVNGESAEDLLPAILITTRHPQSFRDLKAQRGPGTDDALLLIPLRAVCEGPQDVAVLVDKIFNDIREQKALPDFRVAREMRRGIGGAIVDALVLEPNVAGLGLDLKAIGRLFRRSRDR